MLRESHFKSSVFVSLFFPITDTLRTPCHDALSREYFVFSQVSIEYFGKSHQSLLRWWSTQLYTCWDKIIGKQIFLPRSELALWGRSCSCLQEESCSWWGNWVNHGWRNTEGWWEKQSLLVTNATLEMTIHQSFVLICSAAPASSALIGVAWPKIRQWAGETRLWQTAV